MKKKEFDERFEKAVVTLKKKKLLRGTKDSLTTTKLCDRLWKEKAMLLLNVKCPKNKKEVEALINEALLLIVLYNGEAETEDDITAQAEVLSCFESKDFKKKKKKVYKEFGWD